MLNQRPGEKYIEKPEKMDCKDKEGYACWITANRVCGPDCIAYIVEDVDQDGSEIDGVLRCTIINLAGQAATSLVSIKQLLSKIPSRPVREPPVPGI